MTIIMSQQRTQSKIQHNNYTFMASSLVNRVKNMRSSSQRIIMAKVATCLFRNRKQYPGTDISWFQVHMYVR